METISTYVAGRTGNCHPDNVSLRCFASSAHHIRKPSTLMTLLEQKDFIATSGWSGFICEHHTLLFNDDTELEPASLLLWPYCEPMKQTLFCPLAKCCTKKALAVCRETLSVCMHHCHFFRQSVSINSIVITPQDNFLTPIRVKRLSWVL